MGGRGKLKNKLKHFWQKVMEKQPNKKTGYLIIIALIALFLLIVGNIFSTKPKPSPMDNPSTESVETDKETERDRKSTRLNSSHVAISYAVFCLKKINT